MTLPFTFFKQGLAFCVLQLLSCLSNAHENEPGMLQNHLLWSIALFAQASMVIE